MRQLERLWVSHVQATRRKTNIVERVGHFRSKRLTRRSPLLAPRLELARQHLAFANIPISLLHNNRFEVIGNASRTEGLRELEGPNILSQRHVLVLGKRSAIGSHRLAVKVVVFGTRRVHIQRLAKVFIEHNLTLDHDEREISQGADEQDLRKGNHRGDKL